jgi:hypothetical protein
MALAQTGRGRGPAGNRRAPRLAPDERIAPHLTRAGRFRKVDPLRTPERPTLPRMIGVVGWAVLTVEAFRRAWKASRDADAQL